MDKPRYTKEDSERDRLRHVAEVWKNPPPPKFSPVPKSIPKKKGRPSRGDKDAP